MKVLTGFCALALLAGCAHDPAMADRNKLTGPTAQKRSAIVPLVDHHQHLLSPATVLPPEPPLLRVELPPELDRVLRQREQISGTAKPSELYTEDAQILDVGGDQPWLRGRAAIPKVLSRYTPNTRFVPNAYFIGDTAGYIAGTVRTGDAPKDEMNFLLALKREPGGPWRIAAEDAANKPVPDLAAPITVDALINALDDAGIQRAVVLSLAYWFGNPRRPPSADEYAKVRAENDWTVQQTARYPDRLIPFCSVNPLKDYALEELERCSKMPQVKGMKLHFGNSRIDLEKPEHVEGLRRFFRAANDHRMPIVAHLWFSGGTYGRKHSEIFLNQLLPAAPDIPIQIAHLAGTGPGYGPDEALAVYAEAIAAGDPRTRNLLFDLTTVVTHDESPEELALIVKRIRQIGVQRILYGSDLGTPSAPPPVQQWSTIRRRLPLTEEELRTIANNIAPYLR